MIGNPSLHTITLLPELQKLSLLWRGNAPYLVSCISWQHQTVVHEKVQCFFIPSPVQGDAIDAQPQLDPTELDNKSYLYEECIALPVRLILREHQHRVEQRDLRGERGLARVHLIPVESHTYIRNNRLSSSQCLRHFETCTANGSTRIVTIHDNFRRYHTLNGAHALAELHASRIELSHYTQAWECHTRDDR